MLESLILAHEGRFLETILKGGARNGVPRVPARCQCSREVRDPVRQALRPGCEEHRCTDREAMPEMEARPQTQTRHGGAPRGARPASWDAGAPRKRPGPLRDISAFTRVLCNAAGPPDAVASGRLSAL